MFLRRVFSEYNSEVFSGLVFVPFGWSFSLPLISVSQRNPSRVLKYFCLSNRLCFCFGMCLEMRFLSLSFDIFEAVFLPLMWASALLFVLCVFCSEIASLSAIFLPLQAR